MQRPSARHTKDGVIEIWKQRFETMTDVLHLAATEVGDLPMTYCGRLDPLASGWVIVLYGDKRHEKDRWLGLDKVYSVEVLLGVTTDTGDVLGLIQDIGHQKIADTTAVTAELLGDYTLPFPAFSARRVAGKPLWQWTKEGVAPPEPLPKNSFRVKSVTYLGQRSLSAQQLLAEITTTIHHTTGDFRQPRVLQSWQQQLTNVPPEQLFTLVALSIHATSGAYMRQLAEIYAKKLGLPGLAYSIVRTEYVASPRART